VRAQEARELGERIGALVQRGQAPQAYDLLAPVLAERTPFDTLRRIGSPVGHCQLNQVDPFLVLIATDKTEGGWVVISGVLQAQLDRDLPGAFVRCRDFIITADVWYASDTLGEGVPGQALVSHFRPALELLTPWREDTNVWVKRAVGVAVHFWAKRSRGVPEQAAHAEELLATLEPMFEEWDMSAVKGVGWGLKTLGRYYPDLVADWLPDQISRRHRALMLHKALTYLSDEQRARAVGEEKT
jgi:3-methyladenine DNA glycosylase AlkD